MLLLDTHALLWFIYNDDRLSSNAVNAIKVGYLDRIKTLPDIHKDQFDRLIVAQAMEEDLIIVTKDENIIKYNINTIW